MPTTKGASGKGGAQKEAGVTADADALFQLPLSEFTAARNALASRLKKAGQPDEAELVKALAKPSFSAWVVNQLYWRHRDAFDRLLDAGEHFRKAQAAQLSGKSGDLRETLEARRTALAALSRLAAGVVRDAGHTASPDTMRRITTTLEALSVYGSLAEAPPAGRLTDDVDPPGFETLAALVPRIGKPGKGDEPPRIIPFQQPKKRPPRKGSAASADPRKQEEERRAQLASARAAVKEAEAALREARRTAQEAEAVLKKAAARAKEAEKEKAAAEERLEKASAAADDARQQARRVAAEAEEAAQAVEDAERAIEKARQELERLE